MTYLTAMTGNCGGPGLGDRVTAALAAVGVTEAGVSAWLNRPCGCKERREKLNLLGAWASRLWADGPGRLGERLSRILKGDD